MSPPGDSGPAANGATPPRLQGSAGTSGPEATSPGPLDAGEQDTPLLRGASEQRDLSETQIEQQLRGVLGDRFAPEEVEAFARDTLEELIKEVGEDALRKDQVERAMAITVPRVLPFRLCCLSLMTLGLYYFVRPHDDVAVLLLQKSGHVLMLRKEDRPGWSGELKFLVCIILFNLLPPLLGIIVYFKHDSIDAGIAAFATSINTDERFMLRLVTGSFALLFLTLIASWAVFTLCIWSHRQRGYGTRAVRRFKCAYIAAAQFILRDERNYVSFCCRRVHQRGRLRLFFGKYPAQAQMDEGTQVANHSVQVLDSITSGSVATSTEESPTSAQQRQRGGAGRGGRFFALLFFLLSALFQLSVFYDYYEELLQVAGAQTFCGTVTRAAMHDGARGTGLCRPDLCRGFFSTGVLDLRLQPSTDFCRHVRWVSNATYLCPISRQQSCCTFCVTGAWYEWMGGNDAQEWIKSTETMLTYVAAIAALFTGAAVINYLSRATFTPQVELDFVHDVYQHDEQVFEMKSELAQDFMHRMFAVDGVKAAVAVDENRDDVMLLGKEEAPSWQVFFGQSRRLTRIPVIGDRLGGFERGTSVCVPETCLGLAREEKVLKAWDEKAFLTGGDLAWAVGLALLLAVGIVYGPRLLDVEMPSISTMDGMLHARLDAHARAVATTTPGGAAFDDQRGSLLGVLGPTFAVAAWAAPILPVLLLARWISLIKVQCAIVVTSHRVFSIAYRPNFLWMLPFGWSLRLDIFRHDSNLFYGRMSTTPPPLLSRLCTSQAWRSGEVVMQSIFGVLQLQRSLGEVREVFDMVATRLSADVEEKDGIDPGCGAVDVDNPFLFGVLRDSITRAALGEGKDKVSIVRWESALRDDPRPRKSVPVKSVSKGGAEAGGVIEQLLFIWSFQEEPRLTAPFVRFNDIVITTDSIRLSSAAAVKPFDCQTCCCWPFPYYALQRLLLGARHLPEMQSFLNFSHLQAFSTEYAAEPPLFAFRCPCWEVLCRALTRCALCYWCRGAEDRGALRPRTAVLQASGELLDCEVVAETEGAVQVRYPASLLEDEWLPRGSARLFSDGSPEGLLRRPRLASTRMSLFLMVLQKYALEVQPDLILCLRPCHLEARGGAEEAVPLRRAESFSERVQGLSSSLERTVSGSSARLREDTHTLKEVRTLRSLLNIVLENAEAKDLQNAMKLAEAQ